MFCVMHRFLLSPEVMASLPALLIGAFLIERFFGIPGIGREIIIAVERSDFPVIKAITVYRCCDYDF